MAIILLDQPLDLQVELWQMNRPMMFVSLVLITPSSVSFGSNLNVMLSSASSSATSVWRSEYMEHFLGFPFLRAMLIESVLF